MAAAEAIVVGAGIAGVMTALSLQEHGIQVHLIDRWEPGHPRATSSDYNRIFRAIHGKDALYTSWAREARLKWLALQDLLKMQIYVENSVLTLAAEGHTDWEDSTLPTFERLSVPHVKFGVDELRIRFPAVRRRQDRLWDLGAGSRDASGSSHRGCVRRSFSQPGRDDCHGGALPATGQNGCISTASRLPPT